MHSQPSNERQARETSTTPRASGQPQAPAAEMLQLSREECLRLLASNRFGRLAVNGEAGPPVIRPVNYLFDERSQSVVFRTAPGSKFHALLRSSQAAFEVDGIDERSRTGWSVIIHGVTDEVSNASEISRLERLGVDTWPPGPRPHWVQIRAFTVSGRRIALGHAAAPGEHPK